MYLPMESGLFSVFGEILLKGFKLGNNMARLNVLDTSFLMAFHGSASQTSACAQASP